MLNKEILNNKVCVPDSYVSLKDLIDIIKEGYSYYKNLNSEERKQLEILNKNQENIVNQMGKEIKKSLNEASLATMDTGLTILRDKLKDIESKIKSCSNNSKLIKLQSEKNNLMLIIKRKEDERKNLAMIKNNNIVVQESVDKNNYEISTTIKKVLEKVKSGQSLNLSHWADNILKNGKINYKDLKKLKDMELIKSNHLPPLVKKESLENLIESLEKSSGKKVILKESIDKKKVISWLKKNFEEIPLGTQEKIIDLLKKNINNMPKNLQILIGE